MRPETPRRRTVPHEENAAMTPAHRNPPDRTEHSLSRRGFLRAGVTGLALAGLPSRGWAEPPGKPAFPPTRAITEGPAFHWFGYYDKLQFSPDNRFVLTNRVDFEHRSPRAGDVIEVGMIDLQEKNRWIPLGTSRAWCWQQGCMLQWVPGTESKVIWNDREKDRFVSHILDVKTGDRRTVPSAVYALSPDGKQAVSCDFARIADCRPGYGYAGLPDRYADELAPEGSGVTHVNLETGETKLIITHAQLARTGKMPESGPGFKHHAYHLLFAPDGKRFILLHRWNRGTDKGFGSRLITARPDGGDLRVVIPNGFVSHFIWRDATHILSQAKGWLGNDQWGDFLFEDRDAGIVEEVGRGVLDSGGHLSYLRGGEWILNDTYPKGPDRVQTPHLYHIRTNRRVDLGRFPSPKEHAGEWRTDNHPRLSRDERLVCIDSPHGGNGRQLYLIDISGVN
jgi:hypothetical protein